MSAQSERTQLHEIGIDYITATNHSTSGSNPFVAFANWMVSEEVSKGCSNRDWRASGYHGRIAGAIAFGVSHQGSIVRASSSAASEHWQQLLNLADNVTRLDVQVTVRPVAGPTATLSRHHKELLRAPRLRGKAATFKAWYGPSGIEAIQVGKRISDRYGRVYDKGLESQLEEYAGCLRYELELHRELALNTAQFLDSQEMDQMAMAHKVLEFMSVRGLRVESAWLKQLATGVNDNELRQECRFARTAGRKVPEVIRSLKWMTNSVRPAVARLIECGYREEMLEALGLRPAVHRGNAPLPGVQFEAHSQEGESWH